MSLASTQIVAPISLHLDRVVGGQSGWFDPWPVREQEVEPQMENGSTKDNLQARDSVPDVKPLASSSRPRKSISERAQAAAIVLNRYRIDYKNDWDFPESILHSQTQIQTFLERKVPIELVVPAFPFKSSNRSKKVLGPFPDEAERLSLLHLNGLCLSIKDATDSNTFLTIVSDGITYNDILDVSDQEVWQYGQHLRKMAEQNECHYIRFSRICDLVGAGHESETLDEAHYLARVSAYRKLLEANTPVGFDVLSAIANDPDISRTYKGYKKFLMSERDDRTARSRSQTERENSVIAKAMIVRGKAFAQAVKNRYPDFVRLSIHPSNDTAKVSIIMLPQDNDIVMTPWHGAVVRNTDGCVSMSHAILVPAMTHDVVYVEGRPSYFRQRSDVFDWFPLDLIFEYLYPCGIVIRPAKPTSAYTLSMVDMQKVQKLAMTCSPVVLRGFRGANKDQHTFISRDHDPEPEISGAFHDITNITSHEPHHSRVEATSSCKNGPLNINTDESESPDKTSHFQYLTPKASDGLMDAQTLFASSELFVRYLPQAYNVKRLEKIRWTCHSPGRLNNTKKDIPLIFNHPTLNAPCIRWNPPWHGSANISIDNGSQSLVSLVDRLLLDRRVCLRFAWQEGDVVISDNWAMLHSKK
ncbi:Clavaminate synthase-like protein [Astrocystis sublimbata]|nr:Clavaminate synthase-like protein [Astrocystis sublimbata]